MSHALRTVDRTSIRCRVCGCAEVRTDQVEELGGLLLAECPRCDHRWTRSDEPPARAICARPTLGADREIASAA